MPSKVRIRRFGVLRTSSVVAAMYFVGFAVILVPILLLFFAAAPAGPRGSPTGTNPFGALGIVGVLLFAVLIAALYAVIGWVFTAIACLVYNFVARFAGGIEVDVERFGEPAYGSPYGSATAWGPAPASWPSGPSTQAPGSPPGSAPPPSYPSASYPPPQGYGPQADDAERPPEGR